MTNALHLQRQVRLIARCALVIAVSSVSLMAYMAAIHRFESGGPVDQWMKIAFRRRYLAELDAAAVLIEPEVYEADLKELSQEEQLVVSSNDFPANSNELLSYLQARETLPRMPVALWLVLTGSVTAFAAAVFFLRGMATGVAIADRCTRDTSQTDVTSPLHLPDPL